MTDEDKKLAIEYMGWCFHRYAKSGLLWGTGICVKCKDPRPKEHPRDGNDMVAAMNKMAENGDWKSQLLPIVYKKWEEENSNFTAPDEKGYLFVSWLMQPARFFELMGKWLEARNAKAE